MENSYEEGRLLLINKPLEWTSFDVVKKLRNTIKVKKIGHAGTLDPLATGLLLICTGKFTKKIPELQGQKKEYTGTITLGATTPSFDLETEVDQKYPTEHITEPLLLETTRQFLGHVTQTPPMISALKKDGKRLYELAREGKSVEVKSRNIHIETFEITGIQMPEVHFRVVCSKGTYIRTLADDFGKALDSGGHLSALRRTGIGDFHVDNAVTPEVFQQRLVKSG